MIHASELGNNSKDEIEKIESKILAKNKESKKRLLLKSIPSDHAIEELKFSGYNVEIDKENIETIITW